MGGASIGESAATSTYQRKVIHGVEGELVATKNHTNMWVCMWSAPDWGGRSRTEHLRQTCAKCSGWSSGVQHFASFRPRVTHSPPQYTPRLSNIKG